MKLDTLKDLFIHEIKDLYGTEKQIIKETWKPPSCCRPPWRKPKPLKSSILLATSSINRYADKGLTSRHEPSHAALGSRGARTYGELQAHRLIHSLAARCDLVVARQ